MATAKDGSRPVWTEREKRFLEKNVAVMTDAEVAEKLGRTRPGVRHMRLRLGLGRAKRPPPWGEWTPEDDEFILAHPGMGAQELAKELGRTAASANHRRGKLGLRNPNTWTPRETRFLRDHPGMRPKELAQHVDHGVVAIRIRRRQLGLDRYVERVEWTENEIQIAAGLLQSPMRDLLRALPRHNKGTIRNMLVKLGRKRTVRKGYSIFNGYRVVFKNRKAVLEHRLVMSRILGRPLTKNEIVHHIDFDRANNDPDNLDVLDDHSAHQDAHRSLYVLFPRLIKAGDLRYDPGTHTYEAGA